MFLVRVAHESGILFCFYFWFVQSDSSKPPEARTEYSFLTYNVELLFLSYRVLDSRLSQRRSLL
jgi:hypothetical protein